MNSRATAPPAPANEAAPGRQGTGGHESDNLNEPRDCAASEAERKMLAKLRAKAALLGLTLHPLPDGGALIARWGLVREVATLDEAGAFLARWEKP